MRIFYIYNINDYFKSEYKNYPYKLYKMLEDAYFTNKHNLMASSSLYDQMTISYNKLFINNFIQTNNKLDIYYYNKDNTHLISNSHEYTKLVVTNHCLKIKTNVNYPKFLKDIAKYNDNIFVCDFLNKDYFWLDKIAKNKDNLIKQ